MFTQDFFSMGVFENLNTNFFIFFLPPEIAPTDISLNVGRGSDHFLGGRPGGSTPKAPTPLPTRLGLRHIKPHSQ